MKKTAMKLFLEKSYRIKIQSIQVGPRGWTSLGYRVTTHKQAYYLKVYEKNRSSTGRTVDHILHNLQILKKLREDPDCGIPMNKWVSGVGGHYVFDDAFNYYMLFDWLDGRDLFHEDLTKEEIRSLAVSISKLHNYRNIEATSVFEPSSQILFLSRLRFFLENDLYRAGRELHQIMEPITHILVRGICKLEGLADSLKGEEINQVLCHSDPHGGNLMRIEEGLVIIDWEGLHKGPREGDLYVFRQEPFYQDFMSIYGELNPGFNIDDRFIHYYQLRRVLLDLWEHIEIVHYDQVEDDLKKYNINWLRDMTKQLIR